MNLRAAYRVTIVTLLTALVAVAFYASEQQRRAQVSEQALAAATAAANAANAQTRMLSAATMPDPVPATLGVITSQAPDMKVPAGTSGAFLTAWRKDSAAQDEDAQRADILSGQILKLAPGTPVVYVRTDHDAAPGAYVVVIGAGPYRGTQAWIEPACWTR